MCGECPGRCSVLGDCVCKIIIFSLRDCVCEDFVHRNSFLGDCVFNDSFLRDGVLLQIMSLEMV